MWMNVFSNSYVFVLNALTIHNASYELQLWLNKNCSFFSCLLSLTAKQLETRRELRQIFCFVFFLLCIVRFEIIASAMDKCIYNYKHIHALLTRISEWTNWKLKFQPKKSECKLWWKYKNNGKALIRVMNKSRIHEIHNEIVSNIWRNLFTSFNSDRMVELNRFALVEHWIVKRERKTGISWSA